MSMLTQFLKGTGKGPTPVDDQGNPLPTAIFSSGSAVDFTPPNLVDAYLRTTKRLTPYLLNQNTAATFEIAPAVASQTTRLRRFWLWTPSAANTLTLKNGSTTLDIFPMASGQFIQFDSMGGLTEAYYITSANSALNIALGSAQQVYGRFEYDTSA